MLLIDPAVPVPTTGVTADYTGFVVSIIVAVLVGGSALLVAVLRKPAAYSELWAENRSQRAEYDAFRRETAAQIAGAELRWAEKLGLVVHRQQIIGDGFVALSNGIARARVKPILLDGEQEKIDAARDAITTDLDFPTVQTPEGIPS